MRKFPTLVLSGALTLAALTSHAQIAVDGVLSASEISATNYQLVSRYTGPHGFGDAGLLSLYATADANKIYFFLAGTLESTSSGINNSFQLFIDRPGIDGASTTAALPVGGSAATSFQKMNAKLDLPADLGLAIKGNGTAGQLIPQAIIYTSATNATDKNLGSATLNATTGTALTIGAADASGAFAPLAGARMAYRNSSDGKLSSNPGNATGAAGSYGWEIELDRTAMGISAVGGTLRVFAVQNNVDGGYISSDFLPQNTGPIPANSGYPQNGAGAPNLGGPNNTPPNAVDFSNIPGTQAASVIVGATGVTVLGTKRAAEQSVAMSAYPNPASDDMSVSYAVTTQNQAVNITLVDLMGRHVQTILDTQKSIGQYRAEIKRGNLAAGTYTVRVQVGDNVAARQISFK
ncbi:T9SS type A sorting domain-containing protein [Hymenobacter taeanensis]|uniref:T9SS type A sorting domain-containing protein n=1 Tax=Hymenobacter taeanensis TaxID=2735321 RepID=A0A6M6BJ46_9BACT|nr:MULTISPECIES: T9SS type A sorting domain-containing protein [Hymenobacter]QJX48137.1 T9SS type A sorting domain-containing protein [Hymenobacter taeanensis]UOQ82393.1 T9SS type A sorting domain-containing protein [Hymenobacter sp. 5414T-23]